MKRTAGILGRVLLPLVLIAAGGCEVPDARELVREEPDHRLPTLDRIRRTESPPMHASAPAGSAVHVLTAHITHVEFPVNDSLEEAWSLVDENVAAPVLVQAWRVNGLRVGILEASSLETFTQKLPPATAMRRGLIATERDEPTALHRSPPLPQPLVVDVTVPPLLPRHETVALGHAQILAKLSREDSPAAAMLAELIPHHHRERTSLLEQRQPHEKRLDGRIFDELTMPLTLQPTDRVVIGLYRKPIENHATEPEDAEVGEVVEEETTDDVETIEPWNLGRQLLTGRRLRRHVQILLVISFDPPPDADVDGESE